MLIKYSPYIRSCGFIFSLLILSGCVGVGISLPSNHFQTKNLDDLEEFSENGPLPRETRSREVVHRDIDQNKVVYESVDTNCGFYLLLITISTDGCGSIETWSFSDSSVTIERHSHRYYAIACSVLPHWAAFGELDLGLDHSRILSLLNLCYVYFGANLNFR